MPRISYADPDAPDVRPLATQIAAERGSVLELYRMLLHSPPVAKGWLNYLTAIRQQCVLAADLRELVIMRIAALNGASYEATQHMPFALRAGVTQEQLQELGDWAASARFDSRQRAALGYADAMTLRVRVTAEEFQAVKSHFDERLIVELTATVAAYNMVSRFLEALEIHSSAKPTSG